MSKFVGTEPSSYKKRTYRDAVSQMLRNTGVDRSRQYIVSVIEMYYAHRVLRLWWESVVGGLRVASQAEIYKVVQIWTGLICM